MVCPTVTGDHRTAPDNVAVLRSDDMFRALLEAAPDAMVIVDGSGEVVLANAQAERMFGYSRAELLGERVEMLVPARFGERHAEHRGRYFGDPHARPMGAGLDLYGLRKDGTEFPVEISLSPLETSAGVLVSSAIRDITGRKRTEQAASRLAAIVESSHDAIISKTLDGEIASWNAGAERLYGYKEEEVSGRHIGLLLPPGAEDDTDEIIERIRTGELIDNLETVRARKDGTLVDVALSVSPIRDASGNVAAASIIARDISDRLRYQAELRELAERDALTGVSNRRRFEQDLSEQVARARRYGEHAAVLILDIDGFKQINDRYGHRAGDQALRAVAAALRRRLRGTDSVARLGGDEFAVMLPYADAEQASRVADGLRTVLRHAAVEASAAPHLELAVSIGIAMIDAETEDDEAVLGAADRDMYSDKRDRRPSASAQSAGAR